MTTYIEQGDIFEIEGVTSYAHGCNCMGSMGKGIAVQFRQRFPEMYINYNLMCKSGRFKPGDVYDYNYGNGHVYNMATQYHYCKPGQLAKLEYIQETLRKTLELACDAHIESIAMPKIGAGLGGLNWKDVKAVIEKVASDYPEVNLYIVEDFKKKR